MLENQELKRWSSLFFSWTLYCRQGRQVFKYQLKWQFRLQIRPRTEEKKKETKNSMRVLRRNEGLPWLMWSWKGFLRRWHIILHWNDKKELKKPITFTRISIKKMSLLKNSKKQKTNFQSHLWLHTRPPSNNCKNLRKEKKSTTFTSLKEILGNHLFPKMLD